MGLTKPLVQAASTGIETVFKKFGPQLTDAGKNSLRVIQNNTDIHTLSKLNPEQSRQVVEHANKGQLVHLFKDVEDAGRGLLDQSREAKAIDAITRDPNAPIQPEVKEPLLSVSDEFKAIPKGTDISGEIDTAKKLRSQAVGMKDRALAKGDNFSEDALSRLSSIGPISSDQVKLWVKGPLAKAQAGIQREVGGTKLTKAGKTLKPTPEIAGMTYLELHHEAQKAVYSAYVDQAWQLVDQNLATADDVINLKYLAANQGIGLGDYGVKGYNKLPHQAGHNAAQKLGIEQKGTALKEEVSKITKFSNINDLTADFARSLEELAKPMRRQLDLHQRAYKSIPKDEQIKVIRLKNEKDALKEALKSKDASPEIQAQLDQVRKELKELSDDIKARLSKQVKKDIAWDIETLERAIDSQQPYGIDKTSDQYRLMLESGEESASLRAAETMYGPL